ncbi:MAG: CAP domain-containing protein [Ktedonobacteraceae bacterium]
MYSSLAAFLFLWSLSLAACAGPSGITTGQGISSATPGSQARGTAEEQQLAQNLFKQINQDRAANGLSPLAWEPKLENSAHQHDLVMAGGCGLMHQCPDEPDLGTRISNQGVQWQTVGENIGEGGPVTTNNDAQNMVSRIHQGMMGEKPPDDGHRLNLLSQDFHRIGISIYIDANDTLWLTEDFAN